VSRTELLHMFILRRPLGFQNLRKLKVFRAWDVCYVSSILIFPEEWEFEGLLLNMNILFFMNYLFKKTFVNTNYLSYRRHVILNVVMKQI
jgi:hypothetical protein